MLHSDKKAVLVHGGRGAPMRIGLMIGPERGRYAGKVERLRADARWADEAGLATVWIPQIPDEFDALTAATLVGAETSRIEIGTAVVPVQPRHPIALAQQALASRRPRRRPGRAGAGRRRERAVPGPQPARRHRCRPDARAAGRAGS